MTRDYRPAYAPAAGDAVDITTGDITARGEVVEMLSGGSTVRVRVTDSAHPMYGQTLYVNTAELQLITGRRE